MNRLATILPALLATSCVSQLEYMAKTPGEAFVSGAVSGAIRQDKYFYAYNQIGGQGTAQSSMGTAVAFDGQKSFADFVQMVGTTVTTVKALDAATKQLLYKEVTKRMAAGEITKRQAIAANAAIAQSGTAAELQVALAKIAAGQ